MGSVVLITGNQKARELKAMMFHMETAEKNHKLDMERRLKDIENAIKELIRENADKFPRVIFGTSKAKDRVMLSVDHDRVYFSEEEGNLYFISELTDNIFDPHALIRLDKIPNRQEILSNKEFIQSLIKVASSG